MRQNLGGLRLKHRYSTCRRWLDSVTVEQVVNHRVFTLGQFRSKPSARGGSVSANPARARGVDRRSHRDPSGSGCRFGAPEAPEPYKFVSGAKIDLQILGAQFGEKSLERSVFALGLPQAQKSQCEQ
jgi:hypothetical protein